MRYSEKGERRFLPKTHASIHALKVLGGCIERHEGGYISRVAGFDLEEIIECDLEGWNDLSTEAIGFPLLMDISFKVVGLHQGMILIEVRGDPGADERWNTDIPNIPS